MHIPSGSTAEVSLVTFEEALKAANTFHVEYDIQKWIYAPNFYCDYRYILGTRGKNPLICIGINPSTAQPGDLDNTLKSVERIALGNGFDSFIMFNGQQIPILWRRPAIKNSMWKIWQHFVMCFPFLRTP